MRRLVLPAALALVLVLPSNATAKTKRYTGTVTPSGTITFKVAQQRHSKKKRLTRFSFSGVPLNCQEGAKTAGGVVGSAVRLKGGKFNIVATNPITGAALKIHGSLGTGTIQLSGNVAIEPSGTGTNCQSGVLRWRAHRG